MLTWAGREQQLAASGVSAGPLRGVRTAGQLAAGGTGWSPEGLSEVQEGSGRGMGVASPGQGGAEGPGRRA